MLFKLAFVSDCLLVLFPPKCWLLAPAPEEFFSQLAEPLEPPLGFSMVAFLQLLQIVHPGSLSKGLGEIGCTFGHLVPFFCHCRFLRHRHQHLFISRSLECTCNTVSERFKLFPEMCLILLGMGENRQDTACQSHYKIHKFAAVKNAAKQFDFPCRSKRRRKRRRRR